VLKLCPTSSSPVLMDTVRFSRVSLSRVSRARVRIRVGVAIRVRSSFSSADVWETECRLDLQICCCECDNVAGEEEESVDS